MKRYGSESGNNAGSDFSIDRYSDAGAYVDSPLNILRATGDITTSARFCVGGYNGSITQGDISATYLGAPTTGAIFFGNTNSHYLYYDGTRYGMNGPLQVGTPQVMTDVPTCNWVAGYAVNRAGDTMTGPLTVHTAGKTPFLTFQAPNGYIKKLRMGTNNDFQIVNNANTVVILELDDPGNLSVTGSVSAANGRLWGSNDFAAPSGAAVSNGRLVYAGDYANGYSAGLAEPYGGSVVSGISDFRCPGTAQQNAIISRHRYMQLFTTGWFTIGYA